MMSAFKPPLPTSQISGTDARNPQKMTTNSPPNPIPGISPISVPNISKVQTASIWPRHPAEFPPLFLPRVSARVEGFDPGPFLRASVPPLPQLSVPVRLQELLETSFLFGPPRTGIAMKRRKRLGANRRKRTTFSTDQTTALEEQYESAIYVSRNKRLALARDLSLTERQIKIWFQNRRAKDKRIEKARKDQILGNSNFNRYAFTHPSQHLPTLGACSSLRQHPISGHLQLPPATLQCPICSLQGRTEIAPSVSMHK